MTIQEQQARSMTGTSDTYVPGADATHLGEDFEGTESTLATAEETREARKRRREGVSIAELRQRASTPVETDEDESEKKEKKSLRERIRESKTRYNVEGGFEDYPHLDALRPEEGYMFFSDYFTIDDQYVTIVSYFHDDGAEETLTHFWGVNRIPRGLHRDVTTVILEQARRMGEKWVEDNLRNSERMDDLEAQEQESGGDNQGRRKHRKVSRDMETIVDEIGNGASYLNVHMRMMIKAPSLEILDETVAKIRQTYVDRFNKLTISPYSGEQRRELSDLFSGVDRKRGKGFHFTSTEFAGSYSLVTNGLNDPGGEYVGHMIGDINNSATIFDVNNFRSRVVVATEGDVSEVLNRTPVASVWGSKISQAALLENNRAIHIILDGTNLDDVGPKFDGITARLDMNSGDINMLEMFGDRKDQLSIFPVHLEKLKLMTLQLARPNDHERGIIIGELSNTLNEFYVDKNMWVPNPRENQERIRIVGIPHDEMPRVQDLVTYFETRYKSMANSTARDDQAMSAYNTLRLVFQGLLEANGDLFNTFTSDSIDTVSDARRVIYDFSDLSRRGSHIAMAQLINVIGFAVSSLERGDVVIVHGAEDIVQDSEVREYIDGQFEALRRRGGRVAYLYNSITKTIRDQEFNKFDLADYTIFGPMGEVLLNRYQKAINDEMPRDLAMWLDDQNSNLSYLRRGHTNVVFHRDLALGINPDREAERAAIHAQAEKIRGTSQPIFKDGRAAQQALDAQTEVSEHALTPEQSSQDETATASHLGAGNRPRMQRAPRARIPGQNDAGVPTRRRARRRAPRER